jgi:hypothetical protein
VNAVRIRWILQSRPVGAALLTTKGCPAPRSRLGSRQTAPFMVIPVPQRFLLAVKSYQRLELCGAEVVERRDVGAEQKSPLVL